MDNEMNDMNNTNTNNMNNNPMPPVAKKSNALNIIIIVLVIALIAIFALTKNKAGNDVNVNTDDNATSTTSGVNPSTGSSVPEPVGAWTTGSIKTDITFDVPPNYYVSYPVIGECRDVVSISTQTASDPTVPIALIYKDGCVTDTVVTSKYTHREVKKGYVFQTNSGDATVVGLFNKIVASAK